MALASVLTPTPKHPRAGCVGWRTCPKRRARTRRTTAVRTSKSSPRSIDPSRRRSTRLRRRRGLRRRRQTRGWMRRRVARAGDGARPDTDLAVVPRNADLYSTVICEATGTSIPVAARRGRPLPRCPALLNPSPRASTTDSPSYGLTAKLHAKNDSGRPSGTFLFGIIPRWRMSPSCLWPCRR